MAFVGFVCFVVQVSVGSRFSCDCRAVASASGTYFLARCSGEKAGVRDGFRRRNRR